MKIQFIVCISILIVSFNAAFAEESISEECVKALLNDSNKEAIKISDGTYLIKSSSGEMSILSADKSLDISKNLNCKSLSKGGWKDLIAQNIYIKKKSPSRPTELRDYNNPQLLKKCFPDIYQDLQESSGVAQ